MNVLSMQTMANVPVVCIALGPVAGFPAGRLIASHLSIMTQDTSQVLTGGPAVVAHAMKEELTKEELGSAQVHGRNGMVDNVADDEVDALRQAQQFLSYLPSHAVEAAPFFDVGDLRESPRRIAALTLVPRERRRAFKMRKLIDSVVDQRSFFEIGKLWGRSQITGLARMNGHSVGVLANDCHHDGGSMTRDGADKIRRFVELCDLFHLPIVSFVDEPGFAIGSKAEHAATIRAGMGAMFAVLQSTVPWFACVVRRSYGVAQGIHLGSKPTVVAWPSAMSGALPGRERRRPRLPPGDRVGPRSGEEARGARGRDGEGPVRAPAQRGVRGPRPDRPARDAAHDLRLARRGPDRAGVPREGGRAALFAAALRPRARRTDRRPLPLTPLNRGVRRSAKAATASV